MSQMRQCKDMQFHLSGRFSKAISRADLEAFSEYGCFNLVTLLILFKKNLKTLRLPRDYQLPINFSETQPQIIAKSFLSYIIRKAFMF